MQIRLFEDQVEMGKAAALEAAQTIGQATDRRGQAHIIAATGASQFELLDALVEQPVDWSKTIFFHLDEYVGLPEDHPASFRKYLQERIVDRVAPADFIFIQGDAPDPAAECGRINQIIAGCQIDLALVGIGENGHLAFNDPPADFETEEPYLVVELDDACRRQQLGEGWFDSFDEVPRSAISMSIRQILKSQKIICVVPDKRKARAARDCLERVIGPEFPASALRLHTDTVLFLDRDAASLLRPGSV